MQWFQFSGHVGDRLRGLKDHQEQREVGETTVEIEVMKVCSLLSHFLVMGVLIDSERQVTAGSYLVSASWSEMILSEVKVQLLQS